MCICSRCVTFACFVVLLFFLLLPTSWVHAYACLVLLLCFPLFIHEPCGHEHQLPLLAIASLFRFLFCDASIGDTVYCSLYCVVLTFPVSCLRSICLVSSSALTPADVFLFFLAGCRIVVVYCELSRFLPCSLLSSLRECVFTSVFVLSDPAATKGRPPLTLPHLAYTHTHKKVYKN